MNDKFQALWLVLSIAAPLAAVSCGEADPPVNGDDGYVDPYGNNNNNTNNNNNNTTTGPWIRILSPQAGPVTLGADPLRTVPVEIAVSSGFQLKPPGMCAGAANCGHVHVQLDDSATGDDGRCPDKPYNSAITSGTKGEARFSCLLRPAGDHRITVELHADNHAAFANAESRATVQVTAMPPSIAFPMAIGDPTMDSDVALTADADLSVAFRPVLSGFRLSAPGTCGTDADCGHMHLTIDPHLGAAYNCDGKDYNSAGAGETISAKFRCVPEAKRAGAHIIGITLHRDDHAPYMTTPESKAVGAWVRVHVAP
jgi:hypothetical protein